MIERAVPLAGAIASRAPTFAYRGAAALGAVTGRWRRTPDAAAITTLMPHLSPARARAAARRSWANALRYKVLQAALSERGVDAIRGVLADEDVVAGLDPPVILGAFHIGPLMALGPGLERVPGGVLVLRRHLGGIEAPPNVTMLETSPEAGGRARAFHAAVTALRAGQSVFVTLDPERSARVDAPFLAGTISLARGGFSLSRMTQVPIVPIVPRWEGGRIEVVLGAPIAPHATDEEAAAAAAAWLEGYLLEHPGSVTNRVISLFSPLSARSAAPAAGRAAPSR